MEVLRIPIPRFVSVILLPIFLSIILQPLPFAFIKGQTFSTYIHPESGISLEYPTNWKQIVISNSEGCETNYSCIIFVPYSEGSQLIDILSGVSLMISDSASSFTINEAIQNSIEFAESKGAPMEILDRFQDDVNGNSAEVVMFTQDILIPKSGTDLVSTNMFLISIYTLVSERVVSITYIPGANYDNYDNIIKRFVNSLASKN